MKAFALYLASALFGIGAGIVDALLLRRAVEGILRAARFSLASLGGLGARLAIAFAAFLSSVLIGRAAGLLACALGFAAGMGLTVALSSPRHLGVRKRSPSAAPRGGEEMPGGTT